MKDTKRKAWIDFAKFIAMLLVTWEHTSQSLSGETFTNILGGVKLQLFTCLYFLY